MEDINIPMLVGDLEDIVQDTPSESNPSSNTTQLQEREAR